MAAYHTVMSSLLNDLESSWPCLETNFCVGLHVYECLNCALISLHFLHKTLETVVWYLAMLTGRPFKSYCCCMCEKDVRTFYTVTHVCVVLTPLLYCVSVPRIWKARSLLMSWSLMWWQLAMVVSPQSACPSLGLPTVKPSLLDTVTKSSVFGRSPWQHAKKKVCDEKLRIQFMTAKKRHLQQLKEKKRKKIFWTCHCHLWCQ